MKNGPNSPDLNPLAYQVNARVLSQAATKPKYVPVFKDAL